MNIINNLFNIFFSNFLYRLFLFLSLISFFLTSQGRADWDSQQEVQVDIIHGLPFISVNIKNKDLKLILDLGSADSCLEKRNLQELDLLLTDTVVHSMNVFGKKKSKRVFLSSDVKIGSFIIPTINFSEDSNEDSDLESTIPEELLIGHIGREIFVNKILIIDRKNKRCIIAESNPLIAIDPTLYLPGSWFESPILVNEDGIHLNLLAKNGKTTNFILDTGSNISIINEKSMTKQIFKNNQNTQNVTLFLENGSCLGSFPFYSHNISDVGLEGIIGFDFFESYVVCLDFFHKRVFMRNNDYN